jgi:hypothetical protein
MVRAYQLWQVINVGNKVPSCAVESRSTQQHDEINSINSAKNWRNVGQDQLHIIMAARIACKRLDRLYSLHPQLIVDFAKILTSS